MLQFTTLITIKQLISMWPLDMKRFPTSVIDVLKHLMHIRTDSDVLSIINGILKNIFNGWIKKYDHIDKE